MKIVILGFGREGQAVFQFVKKSPKYKKATITICDRNPKIKIPAGVKSQTGTNYLKNLKNFDIIFRSPGVPYNLPEIQRVITKGVKISSTTKLFFDNFKGRIIGITGTKGKGTTATLLYKILKACGKPAYLAGNIGKPMIEILPKLKRNSLVILELSSFQLQDMKMSPYIAVVLDVFPDHMDAHKNFSEYINAKANMAHWQKKSDKIFYFADNKYSSWIAQKSRAKKISVDSQYSHTFADLHYILKIPGEHNFKNALMAATVTKSLGCPKEKIVKVIKNFKGNEHRLELIRKIKGVSFYNDSASTNPQTAAAAVTAFSEPKILICGGKDKSLNYSPLAKALKNSNTKLVILFGENKKKIKKAISNSQIVIREAKNLKDAVNLSYKTAKFLITNYQLPITIVFSPASASFDMFKNYAERGKKFKELVKKLK